MKNIATIILAAGQGKRMKSSLPKVLHQVAGQPLVSFPLTLARRIKSTRTVLVTGHERALVEQVVRTLPYGETVEFAIQKQQLGTGHAVMAALPKLKGVTGPVLILSGDVPLLQVSSIGKLRKAYDKADALLSFLSFVPQNPGGYGRVIKENGRAVAIREHRDCSAKERSINEVNAGIYLVDAAFLKRSVKKLKNNNKQGELYLTDLVQLAAETKKVALVQVSEDEVGGVNDRVDLATIDEVLRSSIVKDMMLKGVTIRVPSTVRIDIGVKIGTDTEIGPNVHISGSSEVAKECVIEQGCVISDSKIKTGARIKAYSVLEEAVVGPQAEVGPMGRLRPGAVLKSKAKVGNFVELKKTILGEGSKASHLAYLGDGEIGAGVNIGAGTIFCNYDGFLKHKTILRDGVFIGSDSQIVAPVTVGKNAYVASGSTITRDVPEDALAISRVRQENKVRIAAILKKRLKAKKIKQQQEKAAKEKNK